MPINQQNQAIKLIKVISVREWTLCQLCVLSYRVETRPTHRRTDANLYPPKRQLTKASEPLFDLEGGAQGQI